MTTTTFPCLITNDFSDAVIIGGTDQTFLFTLTNSAGSPIDLSGATYLGWKMAPYGDTVATLTKSGSYIPSADNNVLQIDILSTDTIDLTTILYVQQIIVTDSSGSTSRIKGKLYIEPAIQ